MKTNKKTTTSASSTSPVWFEHNAIPCHLLLALTFYKFSIFYNFNQMNPVESLMQRNFIQLAVRTRQSYMTVARTQTIQNINVKLIEKARERENTHLNLNIVSTMSRHSRQKIGIKIRRKTNDILTNSMGRENEKKKKKSQRKAFCFPSNSVKAQHNQQTENHLLILTDSFAVKLAKTTPVERRMKKKTEQIESHAQ